MSDTNELEKILLELWKNGYDNAKYLFHYNSMMTVEKALTALNRYVEDERVKARIDEILQMRAVGDRIAAQADPTFEALSGAYDAHILKRAADLTEPSHV